jgi:transposase-like protein
MERLNKEIKRHPNVFGIAPSDTAIERLVGSQLQEQQEATMELTDGVPSEQASATIN